MKRVAIVQSNYIPWKGYFDLIRAADEFVIYDDVQYTRRDWRNRNLIKTANGPAWLTIPVVTKSLYLQKIEDVRVESPAWAASHWNRLAQVYGRAAHFRGNADALAPVYAELAGEPMLSRINRRLLVAICEILSIDTPITSTADYPATGDASERLLDICRQAGASHYLSGPAARDYLKPELFADAGILLEYADYSGYPAYPQAHGDFDHRVSVLDLLFNTGREAPRYLKNVV